MNHPVVSQEEWLAARKAHLEEERAHFHARDALYEKRRQLPWVKVEKEYLFEGPDGRKTLADLFRGRSQLIVQHFMFGPDWKEGCPGCSFSADHVDGARMHFEHHDVAFAAVSRAPWEKLAPFKARMGWNFNWVSSAGSDFNFDYGVSFTPEQVATGDVGYNYGIAKDAFDELPGMSVFYRDEDGNVYHTYSTYARGVEPANSAFGFLDMTPKGRNEESTLNWVRHHDKYTAEDDAAAKAGGTDALDTTCGCNCDSSKANTSATKQKEPALA